MDKITNNLLKNLLNLFTEKEQQFVLLSMERIKEDDTEYLKTLSTEQLIELRDKINKYCEMISKIDDILIDICNKENFIFKHENDIKLFKHYLDLNENLNSYLSMLMLIPLPNIELYKLYDNNKIHIISIFYKKNPNILLIGLQITTPEVSPLKVSPLTILPSKAPLKTSPLSKKLPIAPQNTTPKSDKFYRIIQCNIGSLLANKNEYPFLNAIFEYGIYKKQLHIIYKGLTDLYFFIISKKINEKDEKDIEEINKIYKYKDVIINEILKDKHSNYLQFDKLNYNTVYYTNSNNNKCIYTIFTHNDTQLNNKLYDEELMQFIYYIKYIQEIYIYTLGKNDFINDIKKYFITNNEEAFLKAGWDVNIIKSLKNERYNQEQIELSNEDCYLILKEYTPIANNNKIINNKIIEKIFSKKIFDKEPFYIIHTKIKFPYEEFAGKTAMFNFFKKVNNNKNYIRIMQDSNNKYFNIFSIDEDDNYMIT